MVKDVRNTMNASYNTHLEDMNFNNLFTEGDRSVDPLTGTVDDDTHGTDTQQFSFQVSRVTIQNVYQFLGCQLVMGCVDLANEIDYFTGTRLVNATIHQNPYSLFFKMKKLFKIPILSRQDQFNDSKKYFSVDTFGRDDSCAKVSWYLFHLNRNFQKYMVIGEAISIDESMTNCQSKCKYTVLMKSKPTPKGLKYYMANDAFTGYCLAFLLRNQNKGTTSPPNFTCNIVAAVVDTLQVYPQNMTAVVDNYYGSLLLATTLRSRNVNLVATVRSNRVEVAQNMDELSVALLSAQLIDDVLHLPYRFKEFPDNIKLFQINDINTFQMISSNPALTTNNELTMIHESNVSITQRQNYRIDMEHHRVKKRMPCVARFYNMFMGGTDRFDQMLTTCDFRRRCNRWTVAFHYSALNNAATNAYIIYRTRMKELQLEHMSHKDFIEVLAVELLNYESLEGQIVPTNSESRSRDTRTNTPLLYDTTTDWLPLLLKKTEKIPLNQRTPLIAQPVHLTEMRFHYPAIIQTPRSQIRLPNGNIDHSWRPNCIKSGCTTNTNKCCRVCHVPLCVNHFGVFHHSFEMSRFLRTIN